MEERREIWRRERVEGREEIGGRGENKWGYCVVTRSVVRVTLCVMVVCASFCLGSFN